MGNKLRLGFKTKVSGLLTRQNLSFTQVGQGKRSVPRLLLLVRHRRRHWIKEVDKVLAEQQVKGPIERHADLLLKARQLAQINRPPQKPGNKARKLIPRMFATPVLRPIDASRPKVENENGFFVRPRIAAVMFFATVLPCCNAC
jgi:hypothetical protein